MKKVKSSISTVPPTIPEGTVAAIQKAELGGSIMGFVFIQRIFIAAKKNCSTERTGQTLLICSTSPSSYNSK